MMPTPSVAVSVAMFATPYPLPMREGELAGACSCAPTSPTHPRIAFLPSPSQWRGAGGEVSPTIAQNGGQRYRWPPSVALSEKRLPLDAPRREALDEELLPVRVEGDDRDRHDQRAGHQLPVGVDVAEDHPLEADREGLQLLLGDEDEGEQKLVEGVREGEERDRQERGRRQRQGAAPERLEASRPVNHRGVLQLLRDAAEVAHHQPGRERQREGRVGDDQRAERVDQVEAAEDLIERDEQERTRNEIGEQDDARQRLRAAE